MGRPTKLVRYAVVGESLVYTAALYLAGLRLDTQFKQVLALLPLVAALDLTAWDLFLWRVPGLDRLTRRPRLQGLWRGELHPTAESCIPRRDADRVRGHRRGSPARSPTLRRSCSACSSGPPPKASAPPYTSGASDAGTAIIYALVFAALLTFAYSRRGFRCRRSRGRRPGSLA